MIESTSVYEIQRELRRLADSAGEPRQGPALRTSVMTHIAWVPAEWREAAQATLAGLAESHPSRTILLFPDRDCERDALDAEVDLRFFARGRERQVCSEVVTVWLRGRKAAAPASVALPLVRSDLPVFLRWRGRLPFGTAALEQLVDIADRLIVDSREWPEPEPGYEHLAGLIDEIAVSDIAWARIEPWRELVAGLWPDVAEADRLRVVGPRAEGLLLSRWLAARLGHAVELEHEPADEVEVVSVGGRPVIPSRLERLSPSELLSHQLERFGRDRVYEQAIRAFSPVDALAPSPP